MKKVIVTTTIYKISKALKEYVKKKDWNIIIVGDKKTPHEDYKMLEKNNENVKYLDIEYQEINYKELSDLLGWNTIQRRNIGYLEALKDDYDIIASIDDDNIPLDNWGTNLLLGKEIEVYYYETDALCFDAIGVTNYKNLWHRGYPIQELHDRNKNYKITRKTINVDVQADFWNGDPDIDAVCRLEHKPMCFFDDKYFPLATNTFSPFNSQNTFFTREALKKYMVIPFIGRMDDIWGGYYLESLGFNVVYNKASVFQDRNIQNLTKNMVNEYIGYEKTLELLEELKKNSENIYNLLPEKTKECLLYYLNNN
tara:strand:+ start:1555 stop:2487 length:933 start_codon:yes stop_codon:yes gene_type:complete